MLASKLDAIAQEYNHLLVSQLESQRQYYEVPTFQLLCLVNSLAFTGHAVKVDSRGGAASGGGPGRGRRGACTSSCCSGGSPAGGAGTGTGREQAGTGAWLMITAVDDPQLGQATVQETLSKTSRECEFLRELNSQLLANQQALRQQLADVQGEARAKDAKIADLEEQVRDLMVFLDAQRVIEAEGGELREGSVVGVQAKPARERQRRGRR